MQEIDRGNLKLPGGHCVLMAMESSEVLSLRLRSNWFLRCREFRVRQDEFDDGSLTNLSWLQSLSVAKLTSQLPLSTASIGFRDHEHSLNTQNTLELYRQHRLNYCLTARYTPQSSREIGGQLTPLWKIISTPKREIYRPVIRRRAPLSTRPKNMYKKFQVFESFPRLERNHQILPIIPSTSSTNQAANSSWPTITEMSLEDRDTFRTNQVLRPPFNYATLICMSMQALKKNKVTLDEIYGWIAENFAFYRDSEPTWKLALRQTLVGIPLFQRVSRRKEEPGSWSDSWRLHPNVRSEILGIISYLDTPTSLPQTRPKSSTMAPKLIIQSKIRPETKQTYNEGGLPPLPKSIGRGEHYSPCSYQYVRESMAISDWLAEGLPQGNVDRLIGDVDHSSSSDPYLACNSPMEEFSALIDEEEATKSPMSEVRQSWADERLNLEELNDILGLN